MSPRQVHRLELRPADHRTARLTSPRQVQRLELRPADHRTARSMARCLGLSCVLGHQSGHDGMDPRDLSVRVAAKTAYVAFCQLKATLGVCSAR